jgi:hypothetical protein
MWLNNLYAISLYVGVFIYTYLKMLQCLLHFVRWSILHWQILKFSIAPCQIYNFTMSKHHFHIANFINLHYFTGYQKTSNCLKNIQLIAQFWKKKICPNFVSFGVGTCAYINGLPFYLVAYILTNLHTHLLRLPIHLPNYLLKFRSLPSPTHTCYQPMTKFATYKITSLQVCMYIELQMKILQNNKLQNCKITICKCTFACL